jgi:hypothetical protein
MKQIMLAVAIATFAALPAYSHAPPQQPSVSPCKLDVPHSPAIRGMKLGMTAEEVAAIFPGPNALRGQTGPFAKKSYRRANHYDVTARAQAKGLAVVSRVPGPFAGI